VSGEVHIGDNIYQSGTGNIGKIHYQGSTDLRGALREMVTLAMDLRVQVSTSDREVIDESLEVVRQGTGAESGTLRRALGNLIGIATMAGAVGGPALNAALKVKDLFGL
jgi:hypothetical protein